MSYAIKLWEKVIEKRLRSITSVSENQFEFIPNKSTTKTIFLLRQLMEKYKEMKKDLYMIFIDLEKTYDHVSRKLIGRL